MSPSRSSEARSVKRSLEDFAEYQSDGGYSSAEGMKYGIQQQQFQNEALRESQKEAD